MNTIPSITNDWKELRRGFFRLAVINILSNLMVPLSGFINIAFLGHLVEVRHLAGVTLATILFNYLYRTLGFLRMSTTGVTAQAVGRKDTEAILLVGLRNGLFALLLGLILLVFQYPLQTIGFSLLSATAEVKAAGQAYYDARIWALPATLLNFVIIGWFLGRAQSGKVLLLSIIGNGINILFDYCFIIRLGWQSQGAGFATALSQYAMMMTGLILLAQEIDWKLVKSVAHQLLEPAALIEILTLNRDIFIRTLAFLTTFSLFTNFSSAIDTEVLAENALMLQVVTLTVYLIDGLAYATESLVGILKGKDAQDELWAILKVATQVSVMTGLIIAIAFVLFPDQLFGLLTNHHELLDRLKFYVPWLIPVLGLGSVAFMLDGYFLGLAEGVILRNTALFATLIGFLPLGICAWQLQNPSLLWFALAIFMAIRVLGLSLYLPKTLRDNFQGKEA
ncbi:MAG: guanitoxin biosynthesis MATE family efflux transporter GntT [Snowella sp.]|nr:guanitoxin biosynthesis MATE family efflux transporter GntT [Snowella sp.]